MNRSSASLALAFGLFAAAFAARAETRKLNIQSKADNYDLVIADGRGTVNGKSADLSAFKDLLPVLTSALENDCPQTKGAADITVRDGGQTRYIYIKQGVVTDGKNCALVGGEGLWYFPVHRDFLIGTKRDSIELKSPAKVFRDGVKVFELKKGPRGWNAESSLLLNWDFIERLESALHAFDVRFRVSPEMGKGKTKMILQSGDKTYEFYKLSEAEWAVKKPGTTWLEATDDFSFWYNFDDGVLEDRFSPQIKAYRAAATPDEKMAELQKLEGGWSRNLRDLYHEVVLDHNSTSEAKAVAMHRLRTKPSKETAGVMTKFLAESIDEDLRKTASQILKINDPKGPIYNPNAPAAERAKVVQYWTQWWAKNQNTP